MPGKNRAPGLILSSVLGDEQRVVDAFCAWLENQGWATEQEVAYVDVLASRGDKRLYAEAKGRTASPGLDIDTLYGQLLRRIPAEQIGNAIFAVVVPEGAVSMAERVPARVRELLGIEIYGVSDAGDVRLTGSTEDPT
jgi:hypothetical protein